MSTAWFWLTWIGVGGVSYAAAVITRRRRLPPRVESPLRPQDAVNELDGVLPSLRGFRWATTDDEIRIQSWVVPHWAVAVGIVAFPIGLIALLARRTALGTIRFAECDQGTVVTVHGHVPPCVLEQLALLTRPP